LPGRKKAARMGRIGRCCDRNAWLTRVHFACAAGREPDS
jgi:hypothetical protein